MEIEHTHCAGLDVHKKTVIAAIIIPDGQGGLRKEVRTFATMTADPQGMTDWLLSFGITHVAMESTGNTGSRSTTFWKRTLRCCWSMLIISSRYLDGRQMSWVQIGSLICFATGCWEVVLFRWSDSANCVN